VRAARPQRGFTILELLIVMGLIAAMAVALAMGIRRVRQSDLRSDATRVAQALRTAYAMATQSGKHHRVVFDLEQRTFQVQVCDGDVKLHKQRREEAEDDDEPDASRMEQALKFLQGDETQQLPGGLTSEFMPEVQEAMTPEQAAQRARALVGARLGAGTCKPPTRQRGGQEVPDPRGALQKLVKDNVIRAVWVQHLEDPVEKEGAVSINFFPLGYAEKAVIEVATSHDRDADLYTLLVHGITGRVEFRDGEWRKPEEHMLRDAEGKRVEARE
jgi:prepilin-type N-terminal cleavage/methylation domain-containing protein